MPAAKAQGVHDYVHGQCRNLQLWRRGVPALNHATSGRKFRAPAEHEPSDVLRITSAALTATCKGEGAPRFMRRRCPKPPNCLQRNRARAPAWFPTTLPDGSLTSGLHGPQYNICATTAVVLPWHAAGATKMRRVRMHGTPSDRLRGDSPATFT